MPVCVRRIRRATLLTTAILASATLAGCNSTTQPTMQSVVGRYHVRTINGAALPWVNPKRVAPGTEQVTAVELQLLPDGTVFERWSLWLTGAGGAVEAGASEYGTFSVAGSDVVLTYNGASETTSPVRSSGPASRDGLTLTTLDGRVLVYARDP